MDKLTTMLLTGAAMTGLAVAPAVAAPHFPKVAMRTANGVISLKGIPHSKTNGLARPHAASTTSFTYTYYKYTYTGLTRTQFYKKPGLDLGGFEFYTVSTGTGHHCINYPGQKFKAAMTGTAGKAKLGTPVSSHVTLYSSGGGKICSGTLTFPQVDYQLKSTTATQTGVQENDHIKFKSHYTTTTTTTTSVKHKVHKHKHHHKHTENFTGREAWNLHFK